jgi:hypothetical protein
MLGPSAGTGNVSSFANEALNMPALEKNITPGSVLTIVAARPATQWLKRVSENDPNLTEVGPISSLIPSPGSSGPHDRSELVTQAGLPPVHAEPDTGSTVTGLNTAELMAVDGQKRRMLPIAAGVSAAVAMLVGALVLLNGPDETPPLAADVPTAPTPAAEVEPVAPGTRRRPPTSSRPRWRPRAARRRRRRARTLRRPTLPTRLLH